jgi:hypothetical protein
MFVPVVITWTLIVVAPILAYQTTRHYFGSRATAACWVGAALALAVSVFFGEWLLRGVEWLCRTLGVKTRQ